MYDYSALFERNIGVYTQDEQDKLKNADVLIAGTGGVGSPTAVALCRMGVGRLTLVDFDTYSPSNLNRQLPSTLKDIGRHKVDVLADHLEQIHPYTEVVRIKQALSSRNADALVSRSDVVVCAIDGVATMTLQRALRKHEVFAVTSAIIREKVMATSLPPGGPYVSDFYPYDVNEADMERSDAIYKTFLQAMFQRKELFDKGYAPVTSAGIMLSGGMLAYQVGDYITRGRITLPSFPSHVVFDPASMECKRHLTTLNKMRSSRFFKSLFTKSLQRMARKRLAGLDIDAQLPLPAAASPPSPKPRTGR